MKRIRKALACMLLAASTLGIATLARRIILLSTIFPPGATLVQKVHLLVGTRYEIAAPHQSLFSGVRFALIPAAQARSCSSPTCDSTTVQKACNPNCPGTCGNCPNCFTGPCTIYTCALTTTANRMCIPQYNSNPGCSTCRNDSTSSNCTP